MKKLTQTQIVNRLKTQQGKLSAREFAKALGISHVYLLNIYNGKREPGPAVLTKLGIEREVVYRAASIGGRA
jgi:transcriptional regulator with XRE-family HTH domain